MTESQLEMKKLLFGNQKQANVINDAVVTFADAFFRDTLDPKYDTDEFEMYQKMYQLLKEVTDFGPKHTRDADLFVMFVCGVESYNIWLSKLPFVLTAEKPSTESPKYNFRISYLGQEAQVEPEEVESLKPAAKPAVGPDEVYSDDDTYTERARKIKEAIIPMVPDAVREELKDNEYAQALCCAEYYYGFKS